MCPLDLPHLPHFFHHPSILRELSFSCHAGGEELLYVESEPRQSPDKKGSHLGLHWGRARRRRRRSRRRSGRGGRRAWDGTRRRSCPQEFGAAPGCIRPGWGRGASAPGTRPVEPGPAGSQSGARVRVALSLSRKWARDPSSPKLGPYKGSRGGAARHQRGPAEASKVP